MIASTTKPARGSNKRLVKFRHVLRMNIKESRRTAREHRLEVWRERAAGRVKGLELALKHAETIFGQV